ncbi:hypothetical protein [Streptomyces sp. NBC_01014]|uniref:hypothetical protein n=1 Tax=Streptomyces sp. NBC_01014 TaxID=2903719 RepID=UPI0038661D4A|nr:hypothetical protein OG282_34775 [Streptomyces sp. NBC_01014]
MTTSSRFPHPAPAASRRPLGVLGFALVGPLGAYSLFWAVVSFPSLNALAAAHSMTAPPVLAVTVMLGPAMFWAFIGLRLGLSRTGWAAGLTLTTILIVLTYASLTAQSHGHGFSYWSFLTLLVICSLVAFCLIPNILVQLAVGRR